MSEPVRRAQAEPYAQAQPDTQVEPHGQAEPDTGAEPHTRAEPHGQAEPDTDPEPHIPTEAPTDAEPAVPRVRRARGGRAHRRSVVVLAAFLALAVAGGIGLGYLNRSAAAWRSLAFRRTAEVAYGRSLLVVADEQLAATQRQVAATEAQLAAATGQVRQVANAKAQAEDQQALATQFAAKLKTVATAQASVEGQLAQCIDDQRQLIDLTLTLVRQLESGQAPGTTAIGPQINRVNSSCTAASQGEQSLQSLIASLNG